MLAVLFFCFFKHEEGTQILRRLNPLISHLGFEHSAIILVLPGNVIMDYRFGIEEIISVSDWIRVCVGNYNIYFVHVAYRSHLSKQTVHLLHAQVKDQNFLSWNSSSSLNVDHAKFRKLTYKRNLDSLVADFFERR